MYDKYFYIKFKNPIEINIKTHPIYNNYISKYFTYIPVDERKWFNYKHVCDVLESYNKNNNVIILYQHRRVCMIRNNVIKYLHSKNNVKFKFYLFTFDFWHKEPLNQLQFRPKNYKVLTFASDTNQLDTYIPVKHNQWKNNFIFKNIWCVYNESILKFNENPDKKILISGGLNPKHYKERYILSKLSHKNIIVRNRTLSDLTSNDLIYNKVLNSFFACFSSSVYFWNTKNIVTNSNIILLKTFEILGAGSLLVMPLHEEKNISKIGLINMKNCYLIDFKKELTSQINYIFNNIDIFTQIRKAGHIYGREVLNETKMIREIKQIIEAQSEY